MACVYYLVCSNEPDSLRYIGISRHDSPNRRLTVHRQSARNGSQLPVHRWVRKHESAGHAIAAVVVEKDLSWEKACAIEIDLIAEHRKKSNLLNVLDGGQGAHGLVHSKASLEKMRTAGKINAKNAHKKRKEKGLKWGVDLGPKSKITEELYKTIKKYRESGMSYKAIADRLNKDDVKTAFDKKWHPTTVKNYLDKER